jgi:hypothetical protein
MALPGMQEIAKGGVESEQVEERLGKRRMSECDKCLLSPFFPEYAQEFDR